MLFFYLYNRWLQRSQRTNHRLTGINCLCFLFFFLLQRVWLWGWHSEPLERLHLLLLKAPGKIGIKAKKHPYSTFSLWKNSRHSAHKIIDPTRMRFKSCNWFSKPGTVGSHTIKNCGVLFCFFFSISLKKLSLVIKLILVRRFGVCHDKTGRQALHLCPQLCCCCVLLTSSGYIVVLQKAVAERFQVSTCGTLV